MDSPVTFDFGTQLSYPRVSDLLLSRLFSSLFCETLLPSFLCPFSFNICICICLSPTARHGARADAAVPTGRVDTRLQSSSPCVKLVRSNCVCSFLVVKPRLLEPNFLLPTLTRYSRRSLDTIFRSFDRQTRSTGISTINFCSSCDILDRYQAYSQPTVSDSTSEVSNIAFEHQHLHHGSLDEQSLDFRSSKDWRS